MVEAFAGKRGITLPQIRSLSETRTALRAALRTLYKKCISTLLTSTVVLFGLVLVAYSAGVIKPSFGGSSTNAAAIIKPKLVQNTATGDMCDFAELQLNAQFAACPSFALNYGGQTGGSVNTKDFNVYTGAPISNSEAEYYTDSSQNLRVENGSLVLEAQNQSDNGYKYTSARIDTHGKEDFLYGKIVIEATMPSGIGTWPAIWMMPSQPKYASLSPASNANRYLNDGEMDIAESVGTEAHTVYGIAHSVAYPEDGSNRSYFNTVKIPDNSTTLHAYELDWTPTSLTYSVDGQPFFTYTKKAGADWHSWPFDQPFYLILNLAVGGSWGGTDRAQFPGDGVDKSALPAALKVQSINYYSYVGAN